MESTISRVIWFIKGNAGYLAAGVAGLGLGLVIGWLVWPVQWKGARPVDLLSEYKVLIVNSVAEDQIFFGQATLSPGSDKILGYLGADPLQAVNEALAALYEGEDLNLAYEPTEKELVVSNLLFLQTILADPPQLTDVETLPLTGSSMLPTPSPTGSNQFARFSLWISVLVLVGGLGWVSYRIINPKADAVPAAVRFNSDLEVEEFDTEEEPQDRYS